MSMRVVPRCVCLCLLAGSVLGARGSVGPALTLNAQEYFEGRGVDVLAFSNWYSGDFSDSKLSGVEIIHHGVRTVTNGDVRLSAAPAQWDPTPKRGDRKVDSQAGRVSTDLSYPQHDLRYRIDVEARDAGVLGTHPTSDVSLVSGVGARSKTIAYGSNRADYTFIPGGIWPPMTKHGRRTSQPRANTRSRSARRAETSARAPE